MKPINVSIIIKLRDELKAEKRHLEDLISRQTADMGGSCIDNPISGATGTNHKADFASEIAKCKEKVAVLSKEYREKISPLQEAIDAAEGAAYIRTISVECILATITEVTKLLGISPSAMNGISINADPHAQRFAHAYKYTPLSTHFEAVFKNGIWRVTNVSRERCRGPKSRIRITHTTESISAIISRMTNVE